jgi:hypothetical protein
LNEDNIIDEKTRGAKPTGSYKEPGGEQDVPEEREVSVEKTRGASKPKGAYREPGVEEDVPAE